MRKSRGERLKRHAFTDCRGGLVDIAMFIAQDKPARALTFVDEREVKCDALRRTPGIGTSRPELGGGIECCHMGAT